ITSWTDRNDSTFRYVYDDAGRVIRTVGPDGYLSSTFAYDVHPETGDRVTRYTDSLGATKVHQFNDQLQAVAEIDALGGVTHRSFDRYDSCCPGPTPSVVPARTPTTIVETRSGSSTPTAPTPGSSTTS
ncbi:hypothetical protein, partial [Streptomyces mediolani]|uniref:hypothetical protein n=1 Tax=Streptomyces mediolani TaxID=68237 RepID=UPI003AF1C20F